MLRTQFLSTLAIAGFILSPSTYADDPPAETPEPVTPEAQHLKDVQADAALAKAKLEIAQSEIDLLKLKVGAIDTTNLPKGNATVTDMDLEGKLRAYAAAKQSIDLIASQVAPAITAAPKKVVLATDIQLQSLNQYRSFLAQIALLKRQSEDILKKSAPKLEDPCPKGGTTKSFAAIGTATVAINAMLSVAALFKKDIDLKGKEVTLNDFAMMTMMLQSLNANGVTAIYPAAYYILPGKSDEGQAMKEWEDLLTYKGKFAERADAFSKEYDALPEHEKPDEVCKKKIAALKTQVDGYLAGLAAAGKAIDEVSATLTKQDAQSGLTLLSTYLVSERVEKAIGNTPVLQIKAIAAGGSTQTAKNLFSTKISFGGGSIISYQLFNQDGTLVLADTIPWYAGFIDAKSFKPGFVDLKGDTSSATAASEKAASEKAASEKAASEKAASEKN